MWQCEKLNFFVSKEKQLKKKKKKRERYHPKLQNSKRSFVFLFSSSGF
jgi:hypothetical protein